DPDAAVGEIRKLMDRLHTQEFARSIKQEQLQQFSTPPQLAWLADKALSPRADDVVMEPSAGTGSLTAMLRGRVKDVLVNEIDPNRRALLESQGYRNVTDADAEFLNGTL